MSDVIDFDTFAQIELRVATVQTAERVEGTDRLLRLEVDLGDEERQLVAGIGEQYQPETLVGRQIVVVANLQTARIRGVESRGMLLAASDDSGRISLLVPDQPLTSGSRVS